ncbi:MAG: hypothetical protein KJZ83_00180 [Burkholderiaceae bacterium]|nr:hypothetical protein [Burkholderiaceae bacterium]
MRKIQKMKALTQVRLAVKGWAFAPHDWLPGMVQAAEREIAKLPPELQEEAQEIVKPVRSQIERLAGV